MVEQLEKIKALLASATNPKQKAMYQQLLAKLEAETKTEIAPEIEPKTNKVQSEPEIEPKTNKVQSEPETAKPRKVIKVKLKSEQVQQVQQAKQAKQAKQAEPQPELQPEATEEKSESKKEHKPQNNSIFQAIGIIKGEVNLEDVSTITIGDKTYRLFYIAGKRKFAYEALKKEIETTGNKTQRLIVYPKILHFPDREKTHVVAFQIVGFVSETYKKQSSLDSQLQDFEFKLCGTWQFIPVCRIPCVSVFRNFTKDRLAWIKEAEAARQVKFMKASHLPLLWKDSPVRPFRFNPKLEKEQQQKTYFVELKVRFLPDRDVFGFVELLSEPTEERPNFFKASKKIKAEALKEVESKRRDAVATPKAKRIETVKVVDVEVAPSQEAADIPQEAADIPQEKQETVSNDTQQLTSEESTVFNPDSATFEELKSYVRAIQSDDITRKSGSLAKKSTWIVAFKNLN